MSKNMESKSTTPSVIARLMGLDELPYQQPVKKQKQQRVLSDNYLRKVASIGVWEKRSCDEHRSFRFSMEEQKEFKDAFEVIESLERDKSRTDRENPKLLQKLENCFIKDSHRKYGPDNTCMVPRFHLESNNERRSSFRKIVVLKPKPREAENTTNCLSSPSSCEGSYSGNRKDKGFLSHGKGDSHVQVKELKNFSNGVKSTGHISILSCKTEKEIIRKTRHNISNISLEPPSPGFSGVHSLAKKPEFMMVSSPYNSDLNNWFKPSCYYLDGSYVSLEAKKQISERRRKTKEFRENRLIIGGRGRSRTLGEMLALPDHDKCANFRSPLGISNRDGWKNGGVGDLIKSRSPAFSTSVENPKIRTYHKAFHDDLYMTMRPMFSLNWSRLKSSKHGSNGKDDLEQRNSGSICKKSQSSLYLESEKNHSLEDKSVIHNMFMNNLEKQDPSDENSIVSKSLKHDVVYSGSENKITPIDQWNDIKYGNMSAEDCMVPESPMCTAASPSIASDMVVIVETVGVASESTSSTMSDKDYNSSLCIPDASSQQEDMSTKISEECGTDPDFLVNLETAYQPSPVSVLEAPFEEENLLSPKCFQSVTDSLHDVRQQLEFLKSESLKGYSEGPGMVVSSDDDDAGAVEKSLEDCEVNEDLTRLFGAEESRDFSYLVDIMTEAGFHSRNQDIGLNGWHSPEIPISPSVFEKLEKKYGEQIPGKRSARRLLFDCMNSGLMEILQPCLGEPMWTKPVARRLSYRQNLKEIEEELYMFLVSHEKEARNDSSEKVLGKDDGWLFLGYEVEVIGREIENSLIDELAAEIVSLESF
ncbi:uncharacterized protein LOC111296117 [Durio zibethinus]|uniref:Uncharacterized protein LOC111296117 n=1 Tax=Durio zibethinus TaxID=66656 RepID=A0A6P5Z046_DURZI|nr:uncharacterized protein LOC111296117 [Durio zibethinus]XP_022745921.1 uncharacterized protein LOC111296117 [Durio zibethinus]XP_022745922.1 uncharacterized protein LOC111296117 [Durio zibethinus]XP_022745923.1 uncharacterized protein LOC111296117 [Durio zibethinus]